MKLPNNILKRLFLFLAIYSGLLVLVNFTGGKEAFADFYRSNIHFFYHSFGDGGNVKVETYEGKENYDVLFLLSSQYQEKQAVQQAKKEGHKKARIKRVGFPINSWTAAGVYFLFLIALSLASPVNWITKLKSLLIGGLMVYLFCLLKMGISLLIKFSVFRERFNLGIETEWVLTCINYLNNIIAGPIVGLIIVGLVWFFICIPKIEFTSPNLSVA